jgi:antitoxin MazE
MKTSLIHSGNSRGVRISKPLIKQCGLEDEVEMVVRDDGILIRAARAPRSGWAQAFLKMARAGDDALLDVQAVSNRWDAKS